ncbi:hypothetical protein EDD21DRAFT_354304 [Dissophora ornata]|nr:hypothetical protein EDD21DRAFT_354304 [Dissophora ornata]
MPSAPAESSLGGSTFLSLSGINPGHALSRRAATVELTSTSVPCIHSPDSKGEESPTKSSSSSSSLASHQSIDSPPVIKHWSDETLLPDLKAAIQELKKIQPGPIKEVPWAVNNPKLTPLREPWALAYVQYSNEQSKDSESGDSIAHAPQQDGLMQGGNQTTSHEVLAEAGLALAPPCMAMVMENSGLGGGSRIVTVTKPMLVDQVMDSAGSQSNFESTADLDLEVHESDNESLLSSEDCLLAQRLQTLTAEDKEMSILRVSSSHMLSSADESGTRTIQSSAEHGAALTDESQTKGRAESSRSSSVKRAAADRTWKVRIRQTVNSEADLPEEIRTVARSIFKILREFDVHAVGDHDNSHWSHANNRLPSHANHSSIHSLLLQGIEQARRFGNHAAAIGFHHSLRVLESSPVLRQLDSSKIIYLLAMPIKHRLENREGRSRSRTIWEGFAHSWHMRLVSSIERKRENMSSLRVKMYYQTCVRTSRAFEKSLGVIAALGRLNRNALKKYLTAEEWEKCNCLISGWCETESRSGMSRTPVCETVGCKGSCLDHSCQNAYAGEGAGHQAEANSRRYSSNSGHPYALRASKTRRSSFSTYIDNMTSRSFGPSSFMESSLGHLKEKEQASFSSSYNSGHQGMPWSGSNSSQAGSFGSLGELADIHSDFHMDAREVEAVQRWITETGIHNFLPGEDNFLRFCMEVESVVRGIGLGGTGIQGAGIPQAQNGAILPTLSSSGSDFFVKEVAKYNGQFVAGMGPTEQVVQPKSGGASGVAEFLVNSFKNGHAASSVPNTSGGYFFSHASTSANSINGTSNSNINGGSSQPSQSSIHSAGGGSFGGRSKVLLRQAVHNNHQGAQEAIPVLYDDPSSIYAHPAGPTYALYNPPYSITSHGTSSSYSGSMAPGGSSSTVPPHQISQLPKDMTEFLRRIQLRLTSFVLSEWLEIFGEVETDRWFMEFLDEMGAQDCKKGTNAQADVVEDANQDGYILPLNQMDVRDKSNGEKKQGSTTNMVDPTGPGNNVQSSLHGIADPGPQGSSNSSWQRRSSRNTVWSEDQSPQPQQQRQVGFDPETKASLIDEYSTMKPSASASTLKDAPSLSSMFSVAAAGERSPSSLHGISRDSTFSASDQRSAEEASLDTPRGSGKSLLNVQIIAAFIPGSILDLRNDGKAFWDMALAISSLKSDVIEYIVQKGTQYVEVQESSRTNIQEAGTGESRHVAEDDDERTRMAEAVRLFTIGAKESHPVAQRELAILYMSLPMLPSSSSPHMGYKLDGSPLIVQTDRAVSPVPNAPSTSSSLKFGKIIPGRAHTPPPPHSPKGTFSSSFLGKGGSTSSTASSIPIKQKTATGGHRHHQHSSSGGSGSSFGSGMWSGLGIMTGLGSFTGSSSIGSGGSGDAPNNSSTASLHQNQSGQQAGMFAEGHHDVEHYLDVNTGARHGAAGGTSYLPHHYPHHHRQGSNQAPTHPPNSSGPDKFNPENVAAAMHWFTLAAAQGDKFSINYLKHKETAGGILGNLG